MSLGRKEIINITSSKAQITQNTSRLLFLEFLELIKNNSKTKIVKISNFGSFNFKLSPQRIGRNPKTNKEYLISQRSKLNFKSSNKIKIFLN